MIYGLKHHLYDWARPDVPRPNPLVIWASKVVPVLPCCPTCQEQPQALQIMYSPRVLSMKWRVGVPSPNVVRIRDGLQNAGLNPIPVRIAFSCSIGARSDPTCSSICTPSSMRCMLVVHQHHTCYQDTPQGPHCRWAIIQLVNWGFGWSIFM